MMSKSQMGKSENAKISFGSTTKVAPRGLYQLKGQ